MSINCKKIVYVVIKSIAAIMIVLVMVSAGQFGQYMSSCNDLRMDTISKWKHDNPTKVSLANAFVDECLKGTVRDDGVSAPTIDDKFIGVYGCGEQLGAGDLVERIRLSDRILKSVAWPLAVVAD